MSKRIVIDLNDLTQAINQLNDYADSIEENADKLCAALADIAYDTASDAYDSYEGEDTFAWVYDPEPNEDKNGYKVSATGGKAYSKQGNPVGNMVTFVEFGSGDAAGDHPLADDFGIAPGTWSASPYGMHQYSEHGQWKHCNRTYTEIPATMGMYNGAQEARRQLVQTAKEIFGGKE